VNSHELITNAHHNYKEEPDQCRKTKTLAAVTKHRTKLRLSRCCLYPVPQMKETQTLDVLEDQNVTPAHMPAFTKLQSGSAQPVTQPLAPPLITAFTCSLTSSHVPTWRSWSAGDCGDTTCSSAARDPQRHDEQVLVSDMQFWC